MISRLPRWATVVMLAALAVVLTSIFAWGVIGKHRLNGVARYVFKATRAVCSDPALPPCALPPDVPPYWPPPGDFGGLIAQIRPRVVFLELVRTAPSRAPPAA
jgi:hypothetical protein